MVGEAVALRFFSINGANHTSPGHRPGFWVLFPLSPEGVGHRAAADGLGRIFMAWGIFWADYPGRCPWLVWGRAFGP